MPLVIEVWNRETKKWERRPEEYARYRDANEVLKLIDDTATRMTHRVVRLPKTKATKKPGKVVA